MIWLVLFFFFVFLQGLFSGLETGMVSIMRPRAAYEAKYSQNLAPKRISFFLQHPNIMISTTLIDINISVVLAALSLKNFMCCMGLSGAVGIAIGTVCSSLLLLITELIPKNYFRQSPFPRCAKCVFLLYYSYIVLKPVVLLFAKITDELNRRIAVKGDVPETEERRENFRLTVKESESCGAIDSISANALDRATTLPSVRLGTICSPMSLEHFVYADCTVREAFDIVRNCPTDTIPVCRRGLDPNRPYCIGAFNAYNLIADLPESVWNDEKVIDHMETICILRSTDDVATAVYEARSKRVALFVIIDRSNRQIGILDPEKIAALLFQ